MIFKIRKKNQLSLPNGILFLFFYGSADSDYATSYLFSEKTVEVDQAVYKVQDKLSFGNTVNIRAYLKSPSRAKKHSSSKLTDLKRECRWGLKLLIFCRSPGKEVSEEVW